MPRSTEDNFYQLFDSEYSRPLDLKLKLDLESHGFSLELLKADRSKSLPPEPQTHRLWRNPQLLRTKRVIITVLLLIIGVIVGSVLAVVFGNRESGTVDNTPEPSASTALALSAVSMSANFQTNTSPTFMVAGSGPKALAQTASSTVSTTIVSIPTDSQTDHTTQTKVLATTTPPPTPTRGPDQPVLVVEVMCSPL
ncbi:hypothetical protein BD779DRAFT_1673607 [Infundibulicybe gibba]|nr:hypothetical protein BD779DRAFT_1673607 [Infundibulicybe gibba]